MKQTVDIILKRTVIARHLMSKQSDRIYTILIGLVLLSCSSKTFNTEEELWTYLKNEDNGYMQTKEVNGYQFSLLYKPTDLLVQQELGDSNDKEKIEELRKKYTQYVYFNLSMSKNNKELLSVAPKNRNEFGAMVNELAFGLGDKVHLYNQQKDTIALADFVYPRMYGMSRSTDVLFVYPREEDKLKDVYLNFTIEDLGLYTGEVKFKVLTKNIENEPKIAL